jgi:hypothetical protein
LRSAESPRQLSKLGASLVNKTPTSTRLSALSGCALSCIIIGIWWRNRDILRDFFDYSMVIGAAGKLEAGLKPYTDIRSPMQSAMYISNHATEWVFGRSYLGLTWGGLIQALGGGLVVRAVALRPLGIAMGTLLALAVATAGLLQHTVFFYNPIGILCLTVVLIALADHPSLQPIWSWRPAIVLVGLFVSGINKINFHAVTLVVGTLLLLSGWVRGRASGKSATTSLLLLALFGAVLPLGFELVWTGASVATWWDHVVALPSERQGLLPAIIGWRMYLRPIHDFHHHLLVRSIAGAGLLLLLGTAVWLLVDAGKHHATRIDWLVRIALVLSGVVCGAMLLVTNMESVVLTSLFYPVLTTSLFIFYREPDRSAWQGWGSVVAMALLLWSVVAGYAAWHGSRVLYGLNPPPRSAYLRLHTTEPALRYFEGVRLLPDQIDANQRLAVHLNGMEDARGQLSGVLFGPGLEWMERAYPACIVRHEPVWYHAGTTLRESDAPYFARLLDGGRMLAAQRRWEIWPASIRALLDRDCEMEELGTRDVIYRPRKFILPRPNESAR